MKNDYEIKYPNKSITYREIISDKIRKEVKFHPEVDLKLRFYIEEFANKNQQCQFMNMPLLIYAFIFYNKNKNYDLSKYNEADILPIISKIRKRLNVETIKSNNEIFLTFYKYLKFIINNSIAYT